MRLCRTWRSPGARIPCPERGGGLGRWLRARVVHSRASPAASDRLPGYRGITAGSAPRHEPERWHTEPMSPATPPELDIARVHSWCRQRVPDGLHDELRIECDVDARQVTIYEARPPWQPDLGPEWIRSPVAQLRYTATSRAWTLYWRDRNLRWRQYRDVPAGRPVEELLDEIERDPTSIFWG